MYSIVHLMTRSINPKQCSKASPHDIAAKAGYIYRPRVYSPPDGNHLSCSIVDNVDCEPYVSHRPILHKGVLKRLVLVNHAITMLPCRNRKRFTPYFVGRSMSSRSYH